MTTPTSSSSRATSGIPMTVIIKKIARGTMTSTPRIPPMVTLSTFCRTLSDIKPIGPGNSATISNARVKSPAKVIISKATSQPTGVSSFKKGKMAATPGILSSTISPPIRAPSSFWMTPPIATTSLRTTASGPKNTDPPTATADLLTTPFTVTLPPTATASFTVTPLSITTSPPIRTLSLAIAFDSG